MTPTEAQDFMDPCSPLALTPEGSVTSASTGPLALTPSPLPARLPSLERSVEPEQARSEPHPLAIVSMPLLEFDRPWTFIPIVAVTLLKPVCASVGHCMFRCDLEMCHFVQREET